MNEPLIIQRTPACAHCGASGDGRLFVQDGDVLSCESCFLERRLAPERTGDLYGRFVEALTEALDIREHETGLHSKRVACHTLVLARRFFTDRVRLDQIYWGALLHDIGKIGVPDSILLKHGPLSGEEWRVMETHAEMGYHIVSRLPGMGEAAAVVRCHEERFDGSGYPRGLRGDDIPLGARLFAVIDTLDAITSDRPYRRAQGFEKAAEEIAAGAGSQFDPLAVEAFFAEKEALRRMADLKCTASEAPADAREKPQNKGHT